MTFDQVTPLHELADPEEGSRTEFTYEHARYTIDPHFERWIVHESRPGRLTPILTLHREEDGWRAAELDSDWFWLGDTAAEALQRALA